ncbi:MAG: FkbM family methyltransferase [Acidobacteriota bacterium]
MLERLIGGITDVARRNTRRDSLAWRALARLWAGWLACEAFYQRNPLIQRAWARRESEFDGLITRLSAATPDFLVIQIGACDGLMADPIHAWIQKNHWRGVLVEPQKIEFERLKTTYRNELDRVALENVAIADSEGTRTLYRLKDDELTSDWKRGTASLLHRPDSEHFVAELVPCITLDTLLKRHQVSRIDLLQVDVEGYDFEIIKLIDFKKIRPKLIRYEHRHLRPSDKHACKTLLVRHGYRILEMQFDTGAALLD